LGSSRLDLVFEDPHDCPLLLRPSSPYGCRPQDIHPPPPSLPTLPLPRLPKSSAPSMLSMAAAASSALSKWTKPKPRVVSGQGRGGKGTRGAVGGKQCIEEEENNLGLRGMGEKGGGGGREGGREGGRYLSRRSMPAFSDGFLPPPSLLIHARTSDHSLSLKSLGIFTSTMSPKGMKAACSISSVHCSSKPPEEKEKRN